MLKKLQANASVLPHPSVIEGYFPELLESAEKSTEKARAALQRVLQSVRVIPQNESADHSHEVTGAFDVKSALTLVCGGALSALQRLPFRYVAA